ncbi:MAG: hypothetical protein COA36_05785 [Desulfotalea sp.]|nr:MAG: hypothetical protein COA36_05785 [Desulfotalea sp.]
MKKKLVVVSNLKSFICQTQNKIYVDNSMILTPGAKDELKKQNINIVYGSAPDDSCDGASTSPDQDCMQDTDNAEMERLLCGVGAMVKEEYGIEDPQQLMDISYQVVNTLKNM